MTHTLPYVVAVALLLATPDVPAGDLDGLAVVSDSELEDQRGGFSWAGMQISLGADIRTYIDGALALLTTVTWSGNGASNVQTVYGGLTPAGAAELQAGVLSSGGITMRVGDNTVYLANEGRTAIMHRTDGAIQNVLVNTADNVRLEQQVDATLDLEGFDTFRSDVEISRLTASLNTEIDMATANAAFSQ